MSDVVNCCQNSGKWSIRARSYSTIVIYADKCADMTRRVVSIERKRPGELLMEQDVNQCVYCIVQYLPMLSLSSFRDDYAASRFMHQVSKRNAIEKSWE